MEKNNVKCCYPYKIFIYIIKNTIINSTYQNSLIYIYHIVKWGKKKTGPYGGKKKRPLQAVKYFQTSN